MSNKVMRRPTIRYEDLEALIAAKHTPQEIAAELGKHEKTVRAAAVFYGLSFKHAAARRWDLVYPPRKIEKPEDVNKLRALVKAWWTFERLCSEFGTTEEVIRETMKKHNFWWGRC